MKLICVGKLKEDYVRNGIEEYIKKINYFSKFDIIRVKDSTVKEEGEEILERIENEYVIVLSEEGKQFSSIEFSTFIKNINKDIIFVIGSGEGLSPDVKKRANLLLSFSKMTFLHEMAQLILLEQVYRQFMIRNNRSYHR